MDALLATMFTSARAQAESTRLARGAALGLVALVWFVAVAVCVSRTGGFLRTPPGIGTMCLLGLLLVSLSAGARHLRRLAPCPHRHYAAEAVLDWASLPAMVLTLWAVTPPGAPGMAIAAYALVVGVAEGYALRGYLRRKWKKAVDRKLPFEPTEDVPPRPSALLKISDDGPPSADPRDQIRIDPPQTPTPHFPTDDIAQQLVRRVDADGNDVLEGWVRAAFAPRQRTATAHVAFCPALEGELSVEFEQVEGTPARVKTGQVLPYGVRFDVKLSGAAERAESVLIEFVARGDAALARTT